MQDYTDTMSAGQESFCVGCKDHMASVVVEHAACATNGTDCELLAEAIEAWALNLPEQQQAEAEARHDALTNR